MPLNPQPHPDPRSIRPDAGPGRAPARRVLRFAPAAALGAIGLLIVMGARVGSGQDRGSFTASCTMSGCHDDLSGFRHAHPPVEAQACAMCHRAADQGSGDHVFRLARPGAALCTGCHREVDPGAHLHNTLWDGGCTLCHDPHGGDAPAFLSSGAPGDLCVQCHGEVLDRHEVLHTPVAAGACTDCHDPHVRTAQRDAQARIDSCLRCHGDLAAALAEGEPHAPVALGTCDGCHDPHGTSAPGNLRAEVPELCYPCHESVRDHVASAPFGHSVAAEPGGCLKCHDPHVSRVHAGLRDDPLTLCAQCHGTPIEADDGSTIAPVVSEIEQSAFLHGSVRQGDCAGCHDSHGGDHAQLLVAPYTSEFYAPFDLALFELCFGCHEPRSVLEPRTTMLTEFRNGETNLHYLHVNKDDKGRTCRACHATHGSSNPVHVREWVEYGNWQLPVAFTKTESGGSCQSGCHKPRSYDRIDPVSYTTASSPASPDRGGS